MPPAPALRHSPPNEKHVNAQGGLSEGLSVPINASGRVFTVSVEGDSDGVITLGKLERAFEGWGMPREYAKQLMVRPLRWGYCTRLLFIHSLYQQVPIDPNQCTCHCSCSFSANVYLRSISYCCLMCRGVQV
jgi:hypothetical protein